MKNNYTINNRYLQLFFFIAFTSFIISCDDNNVMEETPSTPVEETALSGSLTEDRTLLATEQYTIQGSFLIKNGATLTIPAGTVLVSDVGTGNFIGVEQGGKINVQGTSSNPVIMRSANSNPGDWGGLVICGEAATTEGVDATAEVGGLIYGGSDDADNSGSVRYLVIKGAGAQINSESQYNGLSLYAVGSGTTIENVAIIDGADDGVEFFGGTVSVSNLYLENNDDDAVDWTEGWNGTVTNTYVKHSIAGFSTAVEADGVNNNPSLVNFTAVSTVGGTGLQFKKQSGATFTNAAVSGYTTAVDMKDNGPTTNIIVEGTGLASATEDVWNGTALDISSWTWFE